VSSQHFRGPLPIDMASKNVTRLRQSCRRSDLFSKRTREASPGWEKGVLG